MDKKELFLNGIFRQNPVFVMFLGMCSALGVTNTLENALGLGISFALVLILSNILVAVFRHITPDDIRIPVYIAIIATLVTLIERMVELYLPGLYDSLGIFLPLIAVNCIVLGRAESFARKNTISDAAIDGVSMGLGFTLGICFLAFFRELLGTGKVDLLKFTLINADVAFGLLSTSAGAFLTLGFLVAVMNTIKINKAKRISKEEMEK